MPDVRVQLIDAATGKALGDVVLPSERLPESFAAPTQLHLGDADWRVVSAEPVTRADFEASGRLRLVLQKVVQMDPRDILFSLPTLETLAPPLGGPVSSDALVLHEDDWRQVELVARRFQAEIDAELAAIRVILAERRKGTGYTELHLRTRIPEPLAGVRLSVADLPSPRRAVAIGGRAVLGGFAFGDVYGRESDGVVVALGLANGAAATPLVALAKAHDLVLVDWCRAQL